MKAFYFIFFALLISSTSLFAQQQGISLGANVHFPIGEWADVASTGFGGSATYEHTLGRNITGVLYSGYSYFDGVLSGTDWSIVPILAGAKFYVSPKQDWYLAALMGASITTLNTSLGSTSTTDFAMNANFGYEIKTSSKGAMDISAGYVYINGQNYIGLRVAYIFKL